MVEVKCGFDADAKMYDLKDFWSEAERSFCTRISRYKFSGDLI